MNKSFLRRIGIVLTAGFLAMAVAPMAVSMPAQAEEEVLTGKSALDITSMMGKGFNIGNTLDATGGSYSNISGHETSWGNPEINKELMHGIKEAGFDSVRIPTTWMQHVDKNNGYAINPDYMARVKEVVDMAYDEGLFVILNVHHESWVNRSDIDTAYVEIGKELTAVWAQIAEEFADYDQHLIFEGMNEPRAQGTSYEWTGNEACYEAIVYLDQLFVETVRGNGNGYNNERVLMIPGYAAASDPKVLRSIVIPTINGEQATNVAVSVHCYSPYNFCLTDNQSTFDPTKESDISDIRTLITNLNSMFINNGIAVVIGECGCTNTNNNNDARLAWFTYFGEITSEYGIPAVVWDNGAGGTSGGECHKYFNRSTGEVISADLIDAFTGKDTTPVSDKTIDFESIRDDNGTTLIVPDKVGFTSHTLATQFKKSHTEGVAMGFSLRVESKEDDFAALLNISKYAGTPVKITAWLCADAADQVKVGIKDSSTMEEKAVVDVTADDWTKVCFVVTPGDGVSYLYFQGNESIFYVDDINISLDTTMDESDVAATGNVEGDDGASASGDAAVAGADANVSGTDGTAQESKSMSPMGIIAIVAGVVAVAAIVVIVVSSKKTKKND